MSTKHSKWGLTGIGMVAIEGIDFFDVTREVEKRLGKDTRNYARVEGAMFGTYPYQDFWHKFLKFTEPYFKGNDSFCTNVDFAGMKEYFSEKEPDETWIGEICDMYLEVLKDLPHIKNDWYDDDHKRYDFWISW